MNRSYCPDCGPAGVSHWNERMSARIDPIVNTITLPMQWIWSLARPLVYALQIEPMTIELCRFAVSLHLGTIVKAPDDQINWRARVLWEEAIRRGISMEEFRLFGLPREFFWATYQGQARLFDGLPRPRFASDAALAWMDDKGIILKKFGAAGVPVPRGGICKTIAAAEKEFDIITRENNDDEVSAVIVKPNIGSRSRHTYVNIKDKGALRHAFFKAKELTPYPVVEEELRGFVFRITLIGGKTGGVMRREPPYVMGDGQRTINELIAEENKNPLRHGPIFHELHVDDDAKKLLAKQGFTLDSKPNEGQMVVLNEKVSRSYGASTTEYANNEIHPDNLQLFKKIALVVGDALVGVDFMIEDIGRSWREQPKCGVIECNSLPFIDLHHYPLRGKPKNVAGLVWDLTFPESRPKNE